MKIVNAERLALNIPFYNERFTRAMYRAGVFYDRLYVYRIETDTGVVGYGDSRSSDEVDGLIGQNLFGLMRDDRIGWGPSIAVLDAAGKAAGVPVHELLGTKLRNRCPVSWWAIDMPPEDWAAEATESLSRGYTSFKVKGRPWRDIFDQVEAINDVVPPDYKLDIDFNGHLLNQAGAETVLHQLDEYPNVGLYESPFYFYRDLSGARMLRERVRRPIVEHFREACLHARCCDGFVVGGRGITDTLRQATLCAEFNQPFWLQLVGTGITTAFAVQLGSVLSHAHWPYVTCHEILEHDLLKDRLKVEDGYLEVSDEPGLGVEIDEGAIERYMVGPEDPTPSELYHAEKRILRISWPGDGAEQRVLEFTRQGAYREQFYLGTIPSFERGVSLEVEEDDGSAEFRKRHEKLAAREALVPGIER